MIVLNSTRTIRYGALIPKVESHTKNISFETLKKIIANYLHLRVITKHHSRTLTAGFNLALQNGYKMGTWYQSADLEKRLHTQKQHRIWSSCRKPALNGETKTTYGKKKSSVIATGPSRQTRKKTGLVLQGEPARGRGAGRIPRSVDMLVFEIIMADNKGLLFGVHMP